MSNNYKNKLQEYCQKNNLSMPIYFSVHEGESHMPKWSSKVYLKDCFTITGGYHWTKKDAEQDVAKLAYEVLMDESEESTSESSIKIEHKSCINTSNIAAPVICNIEKNNNIVNSNVSSKGYLINIPPSINANATNAATTNAATTNNNLKQTENTSSDITEKFFNENKDLLRLENLNIDWNDTKLAGRTIVLIDLENMQPNINRLSKSIDKIYFFMSVFSTVDADKYKNYGEIIKIDSAINDAADHLMSYYAGKLTNSLDKSVPIIIGSRDRSSAILVALMRLEGYIVEHHTKVQTLEKALRECS